MKQSVLQVVIICSCFLNGYGQKKLDQLLENKHFEWIIDSLDENIILYYERASYAESHIQNLRSRIHTHFTSTLNFIGIESYDKPVHYLIAENRQRIHDLVGFETNGSTNPGENYVTAIFSEDIRSVFSNHELFHLVAVNVWGLPEAWINEGMAVYSDSLWNGRDLHTLSKRLVASQEYIPIPLIAKKLRRYDPNITYPLLGSFTKFIDQTYGRQAIKVIWNHRSNALKKYLGKDLNELEQEWLDMIRNIPEQSRRSHAR